MEVDQIQCKFPKISNGGYTSMVSQRERMDDDEEEGEKRRCNSNNGGSGGGGATDPGGGVGGLYGWPSSRIVRVSRATGGKDRHSKVLTSRGLRDRRVRLSVNTAIQFYDLQDRLGYDQPSKAVEWLLAAAASSIAELPPMNSPFPATNKLPIEEKKKSIASGADHRMRLESVIGGGGGICPPPAELQQEAAAGSSSSETSKGSGLSISRSESRFRARERAKERALKKEKENEESSYVASFTELLSGVGINSINGGGGGGHKDVSVCRDQSPISNENSDHQSTFFHKFPMDYFSSGLSGPPATAIPAPLLFSAAPGHHPELQPFSFASDHLVSANPSAINRGTLQSNSSPPPSLNFPPNFFSSAAAPAGNHRHFIPGFDAGLQLYYGDAHGNDGRNSGPKRKDKP